MHNPYQSPTADLGAQNPSRLKDILAVCSIVFFFRVVSFAIIFGWMPFVARLWEMPHTRLGWYIAAVICLASALFECVYGAWDLKTNATDNV